MDAKKFKTMTEKQKAEELVLKFREVPIEDSLLWYVGYEIYKEFALIAVDEIIRNMPKGFYSGIRPEYKRTDFEYWQEVKTEIEKL